MGYLPGQTTDETGCNDVNLSDRTGNERVVEVVKADGAQRARLH